MLSNDEIQAELISYLKKNTAIVNALPSVDEIREDQWQGTVFEYPNIRVKLNSNVPLDAETCNHIQISISFLVFSELPSSLEADQIAGIINKELHKKQFKSNGIAFSLRTTNLIPAIRSDVRTWRSEVLMSGIASG